MLNEKIAKMLNEQITRELFSAYLYLDFANYYEDEALAGLAHWYEVQAQEERDHALLMRRYLIDSGVRVVFEAVERPKGEYKDFAQPLNEGLAHERFVTAHICAVYEQALALKDYKTVQFLDWFVKEQGEEEKTAEDLIRKMSLFGGDAKGLYLLNQELAARVYVPAVIPAQ